MTNEAEDGKEFQKKPDLPETKNYTVIVIIFIFYGIVKNVTDSTTNVFF